MTLEEWTKQISAELVAAGFAVSEYAGFPLVKRPEAMADGVRLLEFKASLSIEKRIYAEGMLIVPAGLGEPI